MAKSTIIILKDKLLFKIVKKSISGNLIGFHWIKNNEKKKIYILNKKTGEFSTQDSLYEFKDFDLNYPSYIKISNTKELKSLISG